MTFPVQHPNKITQGFKESHKGVDIAPVFAGTQNVEVLSPENAVVIASGNRPVLEGQYLKLKGDSGMFYYFGHFASRLVSVGQEVSEGQAIGVMGMTGLATGIHTHHEVRTTSDGGQIDPVKYYEERESMDNDAIEKLVMYAYRATTDIDATPEQAGYWVERIKANNNTAYELLAALGGSTYQGDPRFREKARNYDKDVADASGGFVETKVYVKK